LNLGFVKLFTINEIGKIENTLYYNTSSLQFIAAIHIFTLKKYKLNAGIGVSIDINYFPRIYYNDLSG
jgi:hypothetical protein